MFLTFDPVFQVAYLRLSEPRGDVETLTVTDDLRIDIGPDGTVFGIEFLNPTVQLNARDRRQAEQPKDH